MERLIKKWIEFDSERYRYTYVKKLLTILMSYILNFLCIYIRMCTLVIGLLIYAVLCLYTLFLVITWSSLIMA
jgi:hypothetical protein